MMRIQNGTDVNSSSSRFKNRTIKIHNYDQVLPYDPCHGPSSIALPFPDATQRAPDKDRLLRKYLPQRLRILQRPLPRQLAFISNSFSFRLRQLQFSHQPLHRLHLRSHQLIGPRDKPASHRDLGDRTTTFWLAI